MEYPYEDIIGRYATAPPNNLPTDHTHFAFHGSHGFDYAERAEMLIRLCKDFSVRMYTDLYTSGFQAAIRTGRVGFHRSLLYDLTLRPFEVMAAGRPVVMDTIPDLGTAFRGIPNTYQSLFYEYRSYFKPFFENFKLEYEQARDIVRGILDHPDTVAVNVKAAKYFAFKNHTWGARARRIAETLRA